MRKRKLINKLIITSVIVLVLLGVALGSYVYISSIKEDEQRALRNLNSQINQSNANLEQLKREIANSRDAYQFFLDFREAAGSKADSFRRNSVRRKLADIKFQLSLNDLSYKMDPFTQLEGEKYKKENASVIGTKVILDFTAVDDLRAMRLLRQLEKRFPGYIYITNFNLQASKTQITDNDLLNISRGQIPDLVEGQIEFDWYGIRLENTISLETKSGKIILPEEGELQFEVEPEEGEAQEESGDSSNTAGEQEI